MYAHQIKVISGAHEQIYQDGELVALLEQVSQAAQVQVSLDVVLKETYKNSAAQMTLPELFEVLILSTCPFIERDPAYDKLAAQLILEKMYLQVLGINSWHPEFEQRYRSSFVWLIKQGVEAKHLDERCLHADLQQLAQGLDISRDKLFGYIGLQTLGQRYFINLHGKPSELPQHFWMRVALGTSLLETHIEKQAQSFYEIMSTFKYVPSTPTLLHAALMRPQLSSCYLTYVGDDLHTIFKCLGDKAQLSKWSGGVASDWTALRATGAIIKSINVESQGVIPFLKIANDVTCAINRSGKRRSATVAYMEPWHYDFEDFCDLRKNTGDERRRAHDMNFAAWVPDLFMKRVRDNKHWSFFSPDETPELHELYGKAFEEKYEYYEQLGEQGKLNLYRRIQAQDLWKRMLTRQFETGFPWVTFKDPSNIRSPQNHCGVIHSSNLCTEITLNTSLEETAVCNLGSVNLTQHVTPAGVDEAAFAQTIKTAMRMLDNVIDINFYPTKEAKHSNLKHRPTGLGMMGFQDALFIMDIPYSSQQALEFADYVAELYSYNAILASSQLAQERGVYSSYNGSKWDRGLLPHDTIALVEKERGEAITVDRTVRLDWTPVRESIKQHGMRNSNTMAMAPTATISNISGCFPCIEPLYSNIYVKANMSGEFVVVNKYLVEDLKKEGLWNELMQNALKAVDGNLEQITIIPERLREKYKTAFELDTEWMVAVTAVRAKWVDQSISHNVFMRGVSGKKINDTYFAAWKQGLKTLYYLRTLGASRAEKTTIDLELLKKLQISVTPQGVQACSLENPDCESCQ